MTTTMTRDPFAAHRRDLATLEERSRRRTLRPRTGRDFASNDYLGLAGSPRLRAAVADALARGVAIGSGGSRLLRGNDPEHEALETEAAAAFGAESALYFSSGYAANVAIFASLPQRGDLIVHDALIHASAHDGIALARAPAVAARHNDPQSFADAIAGWRTAGGTGTPWIAVESVYSMDGDRAPLADLAAIAARHDAVLLVDAAHSTGLDAIAPHASLVTLHTCGKALGCEGALICAPAVVRDFLVNRARPFIFSTAPSPLMAAAVREALRIVADEPGRRTALKHLIAVAERALAPHGVVPTGSQILPLILGGDARTMRVAAAVQSAGFDVRGIRPPTVAPGTARLRISITLNVDSAVIHGLADALAEALR